MTKTVWSLVLASIVLSAVAQLTLKIGMSTRAVQDSLAKNPALWEMLIVVGLSPLVVAGLAMYALGAVLWLGVLARVELSIAYPLLGLGFILTMLLSSAVLGEQFGIVRIAGTLLVALGVGLVANS